MSMAMMDADDDDDIGVLEAKDFARDGHYCILISHLRKSAPHFLLGFFLEPSLSIKRPFILVANPMKSTP